MGRYPWSRVEFFLTEMLPLEKKAWMGQVVRKPVCQGTLYVPELPSKDIVLVLFLKTFIIAKNE